MYNQVQFQQQGNKRILFGIIPGVTEVFTIVPGENSFDMFSDVTGEWLAELDYNYIVIGCNTRNIVGATVYVSSNKQSLINMVYHTALYGPSTIQHVMRQPAPPTNGFGTLENLGVNYNKSQFSYNLSQPGSIGGFARSEYKFNRPMHPAYLLFIDEIANIPYEKELRNLLMTSTSETSAVITVVSSIFDTILDIINGDPKFTSKESISRLPHYLTIIATAISSPLCENIAVAFGVLIRDISKIIDKLNKTSLDDMIRHDITGLCNTLKDILPSLGYTLSTKYNRR